MRSRPIRLDFKGRMHAPSKPAARGGKVARRKAKTAVARKLAVIMLAMLKSGKPYDDGLAAKKSDADGASDIGKLVA